MNGPLPVDPDLRAHLARRSAGPLPDGLAAGIAAALGTAPRRSRIRTVPHMPRRLAAAASLALVAVVAVALFAVPALRTQPSPSLAGYPADRALTTAELAALMSGPALPANTALVATVTIQAKTDVCPMNSRPTIGVVEGMGSQVCVIGSSVSEYLKQSAGTGTFAFRYMAPGYLGLIGEITPSSASRLAFHVTDEWPLASRTFLADGHLGATALKCDATETPDFGDILNPSGYEPCQSSWLSEDGSPGPVIENWVAASPAESAGPAASPAPSIDLLALHGKARYVTAGGARQVDSIPLETTRGVYAVRPTTGPCPGASPVDSRGCVTWQVLARVADISLPKPTAPPSAAPSLALAGYPADRALTTAELADLMAGPALTSNTALVASVTIDAKNDVCPMNRAPTIGVIEGMRSQVCAMGAGVSDYLKTDKVSGTFAFQYWAPGVLGLLGEVALASSSRLAFHVGETWPTQGKFLVDGWLHRSKVVGNDPLACPGQSPDPSGNFACNSFTLGNSADGSGPDAIPVVMSTLAQTAPDGHGVFLLTPDTSLCPSPSATDGCLLWRVDARLADDPQATSTSTLEPPATPVLAPTPTPTPSPSPLILPTGPAGGALPGIWGPGNRPLTVAEFPQLWTADPQHLAGRIVIVKGPVPAGFSCWSAGAADASISPPPCHLAVSQDTVAPEGYWAVSVGSDGKLSVVGELSTPNSSFAFSVGQLNAATDLTNGDLVIVEGWLLKHSPTCDVSATPLWSGCGGISGIAATASDNAPASFFLQQGAYEETTGTTWGAPVHGFFLVQVTNQSGGTLLARLETATP